MSLWLHLKAKRPEMSLDTLKCYLRYYANDFFKPDYLCPERKKAPNKRCSHEYNIDAADRSVAIGNQHLGHRAYYNKRVAEDPTRVITKKVLAHSGTIPRIAKLYEHLAQHIREAIAPKTGYPENGAPFSRRMVHQFLEENMGTMIFVDCW